MGKFMRRRARAWVAVSLFLAGCPAESMLPSDAGAPLDVVVVPDTGTEMDTGSTSCATPDEDGDGADAIACGGDDCDDTDPLRAPARAEICDADDRDEDCQPTTFGVRDADGDGEPDAACCNTGPSGETCGSDCDDTRATVSPRATETCDGLDNDCDGATDESVLGTFYRDADGDNHGSADAAAETREACFAPAGFVGSNNDCDDGNAAVNPGTPEICDAGTPAVDEDCDGSANPAALCTCTAGTPSRMCPLPGRCMGGTQNCVGGRWTDCSISPRVPELCDGEDDDCDGSVDETLTVPCFADADNDGYPASGAAMSDECPDPTRILVGECPRFSTNRAPLGADLDCDDASVMRSPGTTEICNGIDDDCAGGVDDAFPTLGTPCDGTDVDLCLEGVFVCAGPFAVACGDMTGNSLDTCDGTDDDCDTRIDEDFPTLGTSCDGADTDTCTEGTFMCSGATSVACSDASGNNVEACNATDDDCDATVDEGFACRRGATGVACTTACGTPGTGTCTTSCAIPNTPASFGGCPHNCSTATCRAPTESVCNYCDDDADGTANDEIASAGPTTLMHSLITPCSQLTLGGGTTCAVSVLPYASGTDNAYGSARRTAALTVPWDLVTIEATATVLDAAGTDEPQRGWAIFITTATSLSATATDLGVPHGGRGYALEWRYNGSAQDSIQLVAFLADAETILDSSTTAASPAINGVTTATRLLRMRLDIRGDDPSTPASEARVCAFAGSSFLALGCTTPPSTLDFNVGDTFYVGLAAANGADPEGQVFANFASDPTTMIVRTQACF